MVNNIITRDHKVWLVDRLCFKVMELDRHNILNSNRFNISSNHPWEQCKPQHQQLQNQPIRQEEGTVEETEAKILHKQALICSNYLTNLKKRRSSSLSLQWSKISKSLKNKRTKVQVAMQTLKMVSTMNQLRLQKKCVSRTVRR